MFRNCCKCISH
ncbi:hypothetical protein CFP56_011215 [Quercus suber]|uniref:Uncharacterized protein n=1 Tax=Quercus suber TaxID=58331 RepID=A0AAW0MD13_QUESU